MKITQEDLEDHGLPLVYQFRAALAAGGAVRPFVELYVEEEWEWAFAPCVGRELADGLGIAFAPVVDEEGHQPNFLTHPAILDTWPDLRGKKSVPVSELVRRMVLEWLAWWYVLDLPEESLYSRARRYARAWERGGIPKILRPLAAKAA